MILVLGVWAFVRALLGNSAAVALENRRPPVINWRAAAFQSPPGSACRDRLFWVGLSQLWAGWRGQALLIVHPATA